MILLRHSTLLLLILFSSAALKASVDTMAYKTIEGITDKMIELISGEIGEERNWDEYRNLFLPTAQKVSVRHREGAKSSVRVMNIEEFVRNVGPLYARDGFEEYSIGLTVNEFNGIANVFQSYYCKNLLGTYEKRGINSYQLVHLDNRWWIVNTLFTSESDDKKIPDEYLFEDHQTRG